MCGNWNIRVSATYPEEYPFIVHCILNKIRSEQSCNDMDEFAKSRCETIYRTHIGGGPFQPSLLLEFSLTEDGAVLMQDL